MTSTQQAAFTRVSTGVAELDTMLSGGFLPQSVNLVEGAPGCGKSTLGMQFLYAGAQAGEPGLLLTFEEFPEQFYRDARAFGWDFRDLEARGLLKIIMSSPEVAYADLTGIRGTLQHWGEAMGARRILIDSITHFEAVDAEPVALREKLYSLTNALRRQGLTALLTRETAFLLGEPQEQLGNSGIHFMVDTYIMLRYVEIESAMQRAIVALKMRGSAHDSAIRRFDIDAQGLKILAPFRGREGIMSGSPQRMAESFIRAFIKR